MGSKYSRGTSENFDESDFDGLHAELAQLAEPVAPPPELKDSIMAQLDGLPQVEPVDSDSIEQPDADASPEEDNVVSLSGRRKAGGQGSGGLRQGWASVVSIAAAVVLVAGVGVGAVTGWPSLFGGGSESQTVITADGAKKMHEIMAAEDVRSASLNADGARLAVVVSSEMNAGGAMVNGAPTLDKGMGAQVWSIDREGNARSAGVIGQEPHTDVWMPLPSDTMAVKVTVEPMSGASSPQGEVLAQIELT